MTQITPRRRPGARGTPSSTRTFPGFANGFVGLWLPRDIEGTLRISQDERAGEVDFATDADAPTCVTTLQLA